MIDIDPELERLLAPCQPLLLEAILDLASNARSRRIRQQAGRTFRRMVTEELLDCSQHPDTLRGQWARYALIVNAPAAMTYLKECIAQKNRRRHGKPNRASTR